jgi:sigma-B regulation protein RsbU (phosphoserine phosphatase)
MFFTFFCCRINLATREMTYSGGGHPSAVVLSPDKTTRRLQSQNSVLGIFDNCINDDGEDSIQLQIGDTLILYTDGLAAALSKGSHRKEESALEALLAQMKPMPAEKLCQTIERIARKRQGPEAADDMSLIVTRIR